MAVKRIANATWERHRVEIVKLYIIEGRKLQGDGGVIDMMARDHEFTASISQYECQLRRWNVKKNITDSQWRAILLKSHKRAGRGKQTQVLHNHVLLSEEQIKREIARRSSQENLRKAYDAGVEPATPPGFIIQSPPSAELSHSIEAIEEDRGIVLSNMENYSGDTAAAQTAPALNVTTRVEPVSGTPTHIVPTSYIQHTDHDALIQSMHNTRLTNDDREYTPAASALEEFTSPPSTSEDDSRQATMSPSKQQVRDAYSLLGINFAHARYMTDNHIVKTFRTRLSASDPHTKHLLQKQLYLLGSARQSDILRDESVQPGMIKLVKSTKSTKSTNSGSKGKTRAYDPRCCLGATCPSCFRRGMPPDMWFCRECGMCNLGEIMPTRCPICGCERQL